MCMMPKWMTCESRRPYVTNSLKARADELRQAATRCRNAYTKDFMGQPSRYIADAYDKAAEAIEAALRVVHDATEENHVSQQ